MANKRTDTFADVFSDLRFPYFAADIELLREGLENLEPAEQKSFVALPIKFRTDRNECLISAYRALLSEINVPRNLVGVLSRAGSIERAGLSHELLAMDFHKSASNITERNAQLIWEEHSLWPAAFSTFLKQFTSVIDLFRMLLEERIQSTAENLESRGLARENIETFAEYPRQLPTHLLYAAASLGSWIGGAINVQYFSYYASIRQIHHSSLNLKYA